MVLDMVTGFWKKTDRDKEEIKRWWKAYGKRKGKTRGHRKISHSLLLCFNLPSNRSQIKKTWSDIFELMKELPDRSPPPMVIELISLSLNLWESLLVFGLLMTYWTFSKITCNPLFTPTGKFLVIRLVDYQTAGQKIHDVTRFCYFPLESSE